ncbi:MAG TPA: PLP-dependent aminotransferase family protein [Jiangellaceae bacterium]|nr:PLP-dependent aminotransferase family protein [Jiangellaceae bacterium]
MRSVNGTHLARLLGNWTASGSAGPSYARLAAALRLLVLDGRLPLATRLPGERELAAALGVSRTTITAAYDALRDAGYAASRRGSGTWTTLPDTRSGASGSAPWTPFAPDGAELLDLAHASPEAPAQALRAAYDAALDQLPRHLSGAGYNLLGLPELRDAVADRFTTRGLPTSADQILITDGAQHGFSLILALAASPGDRVLVEHPTYPNALDAIRRSSARIVPVGMGADGWDLDAISAALRQTSPRLAYLTPDFNNPTGLLANADDRQQVAEQVRRHRTLTVIDETLVELTLDGHVPPPFASYAHDELTITVGSVSKTFWGGLRVGWVRASPAMIRQLAAVRATVDISSAVVEQLAVAHLLPRLDQLMVNRRLELRARRDALLGALAERLPRWSARPPAGGLVLWCNLGAPVSSALVSAAERHGLRLAAGPRFGVDGAFERQLRLPYTYPAPVLVEATERLAAAYRAVTDTSSRTPELASLA